MADYERKDWLAIRDSGSLGQCLRRRSRFIHISAEIITVKQPDGTFAREAKRPGRTLNIGRNAAKRAARAA